MSIYYRINQRPRLTMALMLLLLAGVGVVTTFVGARYLMAFLIVPVLCAVGIAWVWFITEPAQRGWLIRLFIAAVLLRFSFSFILEFAWPSFERTSDGAAYGPHAATLAETWHEVGFARYADVIAIPVGASGYVYFSAATFWLLGYNTLLVKLINGLLAALACVYTYKLGKHFFDETVGRLSGLITAFMPSMILWTSQNLKDSVVLFLSMWVLWVAAQGLRWTIYRIPLLGVLIALLSTVRIETAIGLAVIIALTIGFQQSSGWAARLLFSALGVLILGSTLAIGGYGFLGGNFVEDRLSLEAINARRQVTAYGGSSVQDGADTTSLGGFLLYIPRSVSNFLLRPWPWEATGSTSQLMTIPESVLLWYPLFILAMIGLVHCWRTQAAQTTLLWVYMLGATIAAAPQYGNLGTAYRHRIQLWPCYFILAAVGWRVWRRQTLAANNPPSAIGVASPMEAGQP